MARHAIFAYANDNDFHEVAADIEARVDQFILDNHRRYGQPRVVNQRLAHDPMSPDEPPAWNLGLNLDLPDRST